MVAPMLPELSLAPVRVVAEAALVDTAVIETEVRTKIAPTKYTVTWEEAPAQPALLTMARSGGLNIRADQPSAAGEWVLVLRRGAVIYEGQRALVRGTRSDAQGRPVAWQRLVAITKVLAPKANELRRRALAVDVELSP